MRYHYFVLMSLGFLACTADMATAQSNAPAANPFSGGSGGGASQAAPAAPGGTTPTRHGSGAVATVHPVPSNLACPGDKVVWVNTRSHKYRTPGQSLYGATKVGQYMCEQAAQKEGDKPVKH